MFFIGGIAQLGERLVCNQVVSGSNPLTSTKNGKVSREEGVVKAKTVFIPPYSQLPTLRSWLVL